MGYKLWEACGEPDPKLAKARGDPSLADRTEAAFTKLASECPEKEVLHHDSDGYTVLMEMVRILRQRSCAQPHCAALERPTLRPQGS